jgi:peptidyl-prolyl cis-trans isomerase D
MVRAGRILMKGKSYSDESQRVEADGKIKAIQKQIKEGKDFAEVALRFSEGPSRTQGGDSDFSKRGQIVPPFG